MPVRIEEAPRPSILVADQDAAFVTALENTLRVAGYDVIVASQGEQAVEEAAAAADRGRCPQAMLLNFRLPKLSGLGVVHSLRHLPKVPPVILLSGFVDPSVELVARRFGVARVLFKPVGAGLVLDALDALLPREGDFSPVRPGA